jgi:hypothetical protein
VGRHRHCANDGASASRSGSVTADDSDAGYRCGRQGAALAGSAGSRDLPMHDCAVVGRLDHDVRTSVPAIASIGQAVVSRLLLWRRRSAPPTRTPHESFATHAITEVAAGGAIAFLESDRPDGPRVGDLHSDRAHPRDAVVLAPTSKQARGGTVSERFCLIAAPAVDPALLLPPSAGTKRKPFPGAECEVDGWAWAIAATRRSPAAPPRRRESGRVASGRSSAVLARSRRGPASTGCTPLATSRADAWRGRSLALPPSRDSSREGLVGDLCRNGNRSACH